MKIAKESEEIRAFVQKREKRFEKLKTRVLEKKREKKKRNRVEKVEERKNLIEGRSLRV